MLGVTDLANTFEGMRMPEGFEETFKAFRKWSAGTLTWPQISESWYMLLVYGGTGNGKSRCCQAAVIESYRGSHPHAMRVRWADVVRHLLDLMKQGGYEAYFLQIRNMKGHLLIDDVGSGSTLGAWEWGQLEDIIDYRLDEGLPTVITTNLDGKDIPERIISRFKDRRKARMVYNKAADQRPMEEAE